MPNFAIRHTATTVLVGLTTNDPPPLLAGQDAVVVPADFSTAPPVGKTGRGWWKVDAQGNKTEASQVEHDAALTTDTTEAQSLRDALANLKQKGQALHQATASAETKAFLVALNNFVDVLAARYQPKIEQE